MLYYSTNVLSLEKAKLWWQKADHWLPEAGEATDRQEAQRKFGGDENVLYPDYGGDYITVYIWQISLSCTLKNQWIFKKMVSYM